VQRKKLVVLAIALLALITLTFSLWRDFSQGVSVVRSLGYTLVYFLVLAVLVRAGLVKLPPGLRVPLINTGLRLTELRKSAIYFLLACSWAYVAAHFADDSLLAVVVVIGPAMVLLIISAVLFFKGIAPGRES
jgi:hypothetical protein